MVTLKLHKTREGLIYETFISGLIWLFHHCYCCTGPVSGVAMASCTAGTCAQTAGGLSLQSFVSPSTGDVPARCLLVEVTINPLHSISLGHKFIFQTNCSGSVGSTVFLISLHFALLIRHHLSWPSKRWKADRRPRRVLDRSAKSDSDSDSPFWDCQSVACNVSWHFHNLQPFPKCSLFYFRCDFHKVVLPFSLRFRKLVSQTVIDQTKVHLCLSLFIYFLQKPDLKLIFNLVKYTELWPKKSISVKLRDADAALLQLICIIRSEQKNP